MLFVPVVVAVLIGTAVMLYGNRSWLRDCFGGRTQPQEDTDLANIWVMERLAPYTVLVTRKWNASLRATQTMCGKCGANARVVADVRSCEFCSTRWHYVAATPFIEGEPIDPSLADIYEHSYHKPFIGFAKGESGQGITSFVQVVFTNESFKRMVQDRRPTLAYLLTTLWNLALGVFIAYTGTLAQAFIPLALALVLAGLTTLDTWRDRHFSRLVRSGYPKRPIVIDVAS